jgi:DNA-binding MarR family transcriptional regulator
MYMHPFVMRVSPLRSLPCFCAAIRRATRALTQHYEHAMRPARLRGTQFTILQALSLLGEATQGELGRLLALDSTTLTRTLAIMIRHGWIAKRRGRDRREWRLRVAKRGVAMFKRALPFWEQAQAQVRSRFGRRRADDLMKFANDLANAFSSEGEDLWTIPRTLS